MRVGCSELLFNPIVQWWRKGPIAHQIHRFMWSKAPLHYKISMLAYMFSYCASLSSFRAFHGSRAHGYGIRLADGIAGSITIALVNYILLGFEFPVDGFYLHSFEIWLATTVVFFGSGNMGFTLLEYRLGQQKLFWGLLINILWVPFL